jgi:hypothetical protein
MGGREVGLEEGKGVGESGLYTTRRIRACSQRKVSAQSMSKESNQTSNCQGVTVNEPCLTS